MYRRSDPRWNRTLQNLSSNLESANESAQVNLWTFTHDYISPCFSSIGSCLQQCISPCLPSREDRLRRSRRRSRGRAESSFDFYDDWEYDESDGLLGWGNDELDRLLAGSSNYGGISQPSRQRGMSYGTRDGRFAAPRRKSTVQVLEGRNDPTVIPSSSYFGFLGRLPFKLGGKVLRYKPSAADLIEHPGTSRTRDGQRPLLEESDEESPHTSNPKRHRRHRSHTTGSGHTTDSLSSRGDIFPSEDEDDAVPLDDEFTMALERRTTGDEASSGKTHPGSKRSAGSRVSLRTTSSKNTQGSDRIADDSHKRFISSTMEEVPVLEDLKMEEERIRLEEERDIQNKRLGAQKLAFDRGLTAEPPVSPSPATGTGRPSSSPQTSAPMTSINRTSSHSHLPLNGESLISPLTTPFPQFDSQTAPESGAFTVDDSEVSSFAPTPNRPSSLKDDQIETAPDSTFVPARLPHFDAPG